MYDKLPGFALLSVQQDEKPIEKKVVLTAEGMGRDLKPSYEDPIYDGGRFLGYSGVVWSQPAD